MSEALREYFATHDGVRTEEEITRWIARQYPNRWKAGTLRDHLYGGQVNNPKAYLHHPSQKKFFFGHPGHRYELHVPAEHGQFANGIPMGEIKPGWILIHSDNPKYYGPEAVHPSPMAELKAEDALNRSNVRWHWKWPKPLKESAEPRRLLLAWRGKVFGEAVATVSHRRLIRGYDFAFILSRYSSLKDEIPLGRLKLGSRATNHRSLIRLGRRELEKFDAIKGRPEATPSPDIAASKDGIEMLADPAKLTGKKKRALFRNAAERKVIEEQAMRVAQEYLQENDFTDIENVSASEPFDFQAKKGRNFHIVEVKGTTGNGAEIILTRGEVKAHRERHPFNVLVIVHSIVLTYENEKPVASGGRARGIHEWVIKEDDLQALSYSYVLPERR